MDLPEGTVLPLKIWRRAVHCWCIEPYIRAHPLLSCVTFQCRTVQKLSTSWGDTVADKLRRVMKELVKRAKQWDAESISFQEGHLFFWNSEHAYSHSCPTNGHFQIESVYQSKGVALGQEMLVTWFPNRDQIYDWLQNVDCSNQWGPASIKL